MSRPSSTAFQNRVQNYNKKSTYASFCPPFCNHGGQNRMQIYDEHLVFCKFFRKKKCVFLPFGQIFVRIFNTFALEQNKSWRKKATRPFSTDAKDNASVLKANDYVSLS